MKYIIKLLFIFAFIMPITVVTADTHEDATMDVIEHSDLDHFENEIELPETDDDNHGSNHDDSPDSPDSPDTEDGRDEVDESKGEVEETSDNNH